MNLLLVAMEMISKITCTILLFAGPVFFLLLLLESLKVALQIMRTNIVGDIPPIQFASLFVNCVIWTFYGVLERDMTVIIPNAVGIFVGFLCTTIYIYKAFVVHTVLYSSLYLAVIAICILFYMDRTITLGFIGILVGIIYLASPLAVVRIVITKKSTASMNFEISLFMFLNALSWTSYGYVVADDPMIYLPSSLSTFLSTIQLCLFAVYGIHDPTTNTIKVLGKYDKECSSSVAVQSAKNDLDLEQSLHSI